MEYNRNAIGIDAKDIEESVKTKAEEYSEIIMAGYQFERMIMSAMVQETEGNVNRALTVSSIGPSFLVMSSLSTNPIAGIETIVDGPVPLSSYGMFIHDPYMTDELTEIRIDIFLGVLSSLVSNAVINTADVFGITCSLLGREYGLMVYEELSMGGENFIDYLNLENRATNKVVYYLGKIFTDAALVGAGLFGTIAGIGITGVGLG